MDITAATVQLSLKPCDTVYNLSAMERFALKVNGASLLVFPELSTTGYSCFDAIHSLSEPVGGPSMRRVSQLCKQEGIAIVYGFAEKDGDKVYNSAAFIDSQGSLCGVYRKVHLFAEEADCFSPGDSLPVIDTPIGRVGIMVCWDLAFPEAARCLMLKGAELLISCSAWEYPYAENYLLASRARAYENCLPHIASNRVGVETGGRFIGNSAIYLPGGKPAVILSHENDGTATARITTDDGTKREYPFKQCRRPEVYSPII